MPTTIHHLVQFCLLPLIVHLTSHYGAAKVTKLRLHDNGNEVSQSSNLLVDTPTPTTRPLADDPSTVTVPRKKTPHEDVVYPRPRIGRGNRRL